MHAAKTTNFLDDLRITRAPIAILSEVVTVQKIKGSPFAAAHR